MNFLGFSFFILACFYAAQAVDREPPAGEGYYWRDYEGFLPEDAMQASPDIYVAQVLTHGILQPAQMNKMDRMAVFEYDGNVYTQKRGFKVLCSVDSNQFEWLKSDNELVRYQLASRYFLTGGIDNGYPILIGRTRETALVGKVSIYHDNPGLGYVQDDNARLDNEFEALVYKKQK